MAEDQPYHRMEEIKKQLPKIEEYSVGDRIVGKKKQNYIETEKWIFFSYFLVDMVLNDQRLPFSKQGNPESIYNFVWLTTIC